MVSQKEIKLPQFNRGYHIITDLINKELELPEKGILHLFIMHTSAALTINENYDPTVISDFNDFFNKLVPDNPILYKHNDEGPDDMPAHIKASLIGSSVTIPISNRKLKPGTWQGIYFCEFRNGVRTRKITASIIS